jgi:pimeloyl-ACP methyl ester carboxylesterase
VVALEIGFLGSGRSQGPVFNRKPISSCVASTSWEPASVAAFERYVVPAPKRILSQAAFANLNSVPVSFENDSRAPLLLIARRNDRVAPSALVKANFDRYRESKAGTDYKEFPGQTHFSFLRKTNVADYVLGWALCRANGSKLAAFPKQTDAWSVQLSK